MGKTARRGIAQGMAGLVLLGALMLASAGPGAADPNNPCDSSAPMVQFSSWCDSALGPLRDVTANWQSYQPSIVQPIPMTDYCPNEPSCSLGDPEDGPPPVTGPTIGAAGRCGTETVHQPASPPLVAASGEALNWVAARDMLTSTPSALQPPPGKNNPYLNSPYCVLQYLGADFTPLCAGCHRILIDYSAIKSGTYNSTSPASDGHWAARFTTGSNFSSMTPFNGHSPNIKNICADKQFNDAPGAGCTPYWTAFDDGSHAFEGDSTIFHHFPYEGRYYNGPSYLAGDGITSPYHWVNGAYFDLDPAGSTSNDVWYAAGYRGNLPNDLPDTDWSYGCACEVPTGTVLTTILPDLPGLATIPAGGGHTTWSQSLTVRSATTPPSGSSPGGPGGAGPSQAGGSNRGLPTTSTGALPFAPAGWVLGASIALTALFAAARGLPRMRRR